MANWSILKTAIANAINVNGNQEITGTVLQNTLDSIVNSVGENATFAGVATPTTNPGIHDGPVFYIATTAGYYSNFGNIEVLKGESAILRQISNNTWMKSVIKPMTDFNSVFDAEGNSLEESISVLEQNDTSLEKSIKDVADKIDNYTPPVNSFEDNDYAFLDGANTHVITNRGNPIKPMTDFNSVFDAEGNSLEDAFAKFKAVIKGVRPIDVIDTLRDSGLYFINVSDDPLSTIAMGVLEVFNAGMRRMAHQRLTTNCINPNESYISHEDSAAPRTWERRYNFASLESVPPRGTWSEWIDISTDTLGKQVAKNEESLNRISRNLPTTINLTSNSSGVALVLSNGEEDLGTDTTIAAATPTSAGVMSAQDKMDLNNLKDQAGAGKVSGVLNLTSSSCIYSLPSMKENELRLYIAGDSNGNYPAKNGDKYVKVHDSVKLDNFLNTGPSLYVNVGDIIAVIGNKTLLGITKVCRVIPLNDAKAGLTDGIMTKDDKAELNMMSADMGELRSAIDNTTLNSYGESNMNNALEQGVYPWCTLGRPNGSTGAYTCVVLKSFDADSGGYYTIEQTAYGREGELGQVYKRIIFQKSDGSDTQYGEWIRIGG